MIRVRDTNDMLYMHGTCHVRIKYENETFETNYNRSVGRVRGSEF